MSAVQSYRTSSPVIVRPISIRWISLVPSKIVKILDYGAVSAGQRPSGHHGISTDPARPIRDERRFPPGPSPLSSVYNRTPSRHPGPSDRPLSKTPQLIHLRYIRAPTYSENGLQHACQCGQRHADGAARGPDARQCPGKTPGRPLSDRHGSITARTDPSPDFSRGLMAAAGGRLAGCWSWILGPGYDVSPAVGPGGRGLHWPRVSFLRDGTGFWLVRRGAGWRGRAARR
jgi:hypothetical protein